MRNDKQYEDMMYEILSSHSGAAEDTLLPGCYVVPLGEQFPTFRWL
jgi:hypothetical protein